MLLVAAALAAATYAGLMTPWRLLTMTFLLGLGSALNAPAWQATTPELVPREEVPAAVALSGVSMNVARAVGPAVGGLVVAAAGPAAAFLLNAFSFLGVLSVLVRGAGPGRRVPCPPALPGGDAGGGPLRPAFPAGSGPSSSGPRPTSSGQCAGCAVLVKQDTDRLGPAHYGILLACFGAGAVLGVLLLPALTRWLDADRTLTASTLVLAAATLGVAWLPYSRCRASSWCPRGRPGSPP